MERFTIPHIFVSISKFIPKEILIGIVLNNPIIHEFKIVTVCDYIQWVESV